MFFGKPTGLPSEKLQSQVQLEANLKSVFPKFSQADQVGLSKEEYEGLLNAWDNFKGPVKNPDKFVVCHLIDDEEGIYATARYEKGKVDVDIEGEEDIDLAECAQIPRPRQRETKKRIGPNDPCGCGSGRKAKKCCESRI